MIYNTSVEQPVNDVLKQHHKLLKWFMMFFLVNLNMNLRLKIEVPPSKALVFKPYSK